MRAVRAWLGTDDESSRPRGCLIALAGLPGSGKSHLAHEVRAATGAVVLRTDEVRRLLFPAPTYSPEESGIVYMTCFATVRALLHDRHAVVLDGTNGRRSGRRLLAAIARIEDADHVSVLVHAPPDVVRKRIAQRESGLSPSFGSAAGVAIYEKMKATENYDGQFDIVVDSGGDIGAVVRQLATRVAAHPPLGNRRSEP